MTKRADRICLECGGILKGRSDQKFCSDQCRASYNNAANATRSHYLRSINLILRKNRKILESHYDSGLKEIHKTILQAHGFNFNFFTHQYTLRGKNWKCCYDYRYIEKNSRVEVRKVTEHL